MCADHTLGRRAMAAALGLTMAGTACAPFEGRVEHPANLTGKWVRLLQDGSWGDTLEYLADGRILGSSAHPVPPTARWQVVRTRVAGDGLCTEDQLQHACQNFRVEGDTIVVGDLEHPSYFRRVR